MSEVYASWIDGTNVRAQRQGYFLQQEMGGKGATFRTHTNPGDPGEWFQWAIPTPVIMQGTRLSVTKIFVLYSTRGTTKIRGIDVYDSNFRIKRFGDLHLSGDHWRDLDSKNVWEIPQPHAMKFGLGISVLVDFGPASPVGVPEITFYSAGADFAAL